MYSDLAPGTISFKKDKAGKVIGVTSSAYGHEAEGEKLESYLSPAKRLTQARTENLDSYVGTYDVDKDLPVTITRRDGQLFVQSGRQLQMALVQTRRGFYAYEARAAFVFEKDPSGEITGLTIHQDGEHKGTRGRQEPEGQARP